MASPSVYEAIRAHLLAQWSATPLRFDNEAADARGRAMPPEPPEPWVAVDITGTIYGQRSIGAGVQAHNRWDEEGLLWLRVLVPAGSGSAVARGHARALADLFRGALLADGNLEFMDAVIGRGDPSDEQGNWWELPVTIEWRRIDA